MKRVLIDNCVPRPLSLFLTSMYLVTEARKRGWGRLQNGDLLREGEDAGFDILVTTDKNMRYQQNLTGRKISVVLLEQQEGSAFIMRRPILKTPLTAEDS